MIIIPTEKRFDWDRAPIMLFSIVLINVLVFFVYQSGDNEQFETALYEYKKEQLLEIEWPFYKEYLTQNDEQASLQESKLMYDSKQYDQVIFNIIMREDFYQYLKVEKYEYFTTAPIGNWFEKRKKVNAAIESTSLSSSALKPANLNIFDLITHQFLHGGIMHLLGNLFFLIVCGFAVEAAIGHWRFLAFYVVSGIMGGLLYAVINLKSTTPLVGASGAISGVMAMYLGMFRLKKIEFFYWIFIFVGYFKAPALFILFFYLGKEIFQFFLVTDSNVAFMAHAGGFITGGLLTAIAYYLNPKIYDQEYIEEDQTIDPNQEKLATIYDFIGKYQFEAAKKALERAIDENGLSFDFALLRYNLVKIDKDKDYQGHMTALLTTQNPTDYELEKLEKIWAENPEQHQQLNDEVALKIAHNFSKLSDPTPAATILDQLMEDNCTDYSLGVLARKISIAFGKINNPEKQRKYEAIAESLLVGKA